MANIRVWLEEAVKQYKEPILAVVVGQHDNKRWDQDEPLPDENIVLKPEVALQKLDLEFNDGFGGADCFPILAWTKSRVFFIHEYDGATSLRWVPRKPIAIAPEFSGQTCD